MSNASLFQIIFVGIVSLAIGIGLGLYFKLRQDKTASSNGVTVVTGEDGALHIPVITDRKKIRNKVITFFIVTLFVVSTSSGIVLNAIQQSVNDEVAQCQEDFQKVLNERSKISVEDSAISEDNDDAVHDLMVAFLQLSPADPEARDKSRLLIESYTRRTDANVQAKSEIDKRRADNPLPPPRC